MENQISEQHREQERTGQQGTNEPWKNPDQTSQNERRGAGPIWAGVLLLFLVVGVVAVILSGKPNAGANDPQTAAAARDATTIPNASVGGPNDTRGAAGNGR
jgi:hypothetical protein